MKLNVFPNSQLGGDNDLLSQVRSGAIEICQPAGQILASILPLTAINGMGFAFSSYDQVWPTMDGELGKFVRAQVTAKVNLVPMERIWDLGFRQITNSIKPIKSAADLSGMKLRVPGAPSLVDRL
jgi:TRAP-type C4-dicarboxylate transport system substrate-binding protein